MSAPSTRSTARPSCPTGIDSLIHPIGVLAAAYDAERICELLVKLKTVSPVLFHRAAKSR
jgi:hypothetical protein